MASQPSPGGSPRTVSSAASAWRSTSTSASRRYGPIFGRSAAGGVFVPVNPLLKAKQVGYILDDCAVRVLVTPPERLDLLRDELAST